MLNELAKTERGFTLRENRQSVSQTDTECALITAPVIKDFIAFLLAVLFRLETVLLDWLLLTLILCCSFLCFISSVFVH